MLLIVPSLNTTAAEGRLSFKKLVRFSLYREKGAKITIPSLSLFHIREISSVVEAANESPLKPYRRKDGQVDSDKGLELDAPPRPWHVHRFSLFRRFSLVV